MNYQALRDELLTSPQAPIYAPYVVTNDMPKQDASAKDQALADLLNAPAGTRIETTFVDSLMILSAFPTTGDITGASMLDKLEAAKAIIPAVKWALYSIVSDKGVNLGDQNARDMLDFMAANAIAGFTQAEADALKALAERPSSAAYDVVGGPATAEDVSIALRGSAGFTPA